MCIRDSRRISGTMASLVGLAAATLPHEVDLAIGRFLLAHAIIFAWGGIPVLWSGDELAMLNDPAWGAEEGHVGDNRWAHRPRLDRDLAKSRHDPTTMGAVSYTHLRAHETVLDLVCR